MDLFVSLCVGLSLAAACGMRVFLPLVALSAASNLGVVHLGAGMEWLGGWPMMIGLSIAAGIELVGYSVPWVDHALDTIATPLAVAAGGLAMLASTGAVDHLHPAIVGGAAMLTGAGVAGTVQLGTVAARGVSSATTLGLANPLFAMVENAASAVLSVMAIVVPVLGALLLVTIAWLLARRWWGRRNAVIPAPAPAGFRLSRSGVRAPG